MDHDDGNMVLVYRVPDRGIKSVDHYGVGTRERGAVVPVALTTCRV